MEVCLQAGIGEASVGREAPPAPTTCEVRDIHENPGPHHVIHEHQHQQHHHHHHQPHQIATTAFHISRPSHSISTIISPPPLHHTSIILDEDSFHVSRMMLQNENFQQHQPQQPQQQHHKLGGRSASGLEELIMGCTSTDIKEESSLPNTQEAEWLKYSNFWPDPDNPDHHG
ncbi:unnamed protein product [Ilex paraguariensis]|uniref:Uncharacterized protein n=1 Tax=Ilex paraguariensis TaxID=185542 RepID=A0ABC8UV50_9AQUA